jgi:hypothetical protein
MSKKQAPSKNLVLYKAPNGDIELRGDIQHETLWATQAQMAKVFGVNVPAVNKHIKNILDAKELANSTISKMEIVQQEGSRKVVRAVEHYNLDMIIAVGYRINSIQGTKFRQWATKTLRQYLTQGFVLNKKLIKKNTRAFLKSIQDIQALLPEHVALELSTSAYYFSR